MPQTIRKDRESGKVEHTENSLLASPRSSALRTCFTPFYSPLDQIQGVGGKGGKLLSWYNSHSDGVQLCVREQASVVEPCSDDSCGEVGKVFLDGVVMSEPSHSQNSGFFSEDRMSQEDAYVGCAVPCGQLCWSSSFDSALEAQVAGSRTSGQFESSMDFWA